jgi:hypothetical protein
MFTRSRRTFVQAILALAVFSTASCALAQRQRRGFRRWDESRTRELSPEESQKAIQALDDLIQEAKSAGKIAPGKIDEAVSAVSQAAQALPPEKLLSKLSALQECRADSAIPTPESPLGRDRQLDQRILSAQVRALKNVPLEQVQAHPCSRSFPGSVPANAKRVSRKVEIETDVPGWHNSGRYGNPSSPYWHSTGLYAVAGEVICVTVPESVTEKGLQLRIGCHSDQLWRRRSWSRSPDICVRYPITETLTKAASAFGGLIYIESPSELRLPVFTAKIDGAALAPYYVHGRTDPAEWRDSIRNYPAPWAELQTSKVILTLPSKDVRKLDDPKGLMDFWDRIMDCYAELLGLSPQRRRIERFVSDVQISAGYMHAGYPLMTMLDITSTMVDKDRIRANAHHGVWGLFHEIGHNHQSGDWTFAGTTEVTVNLFSLYVMETICGLPIGGHPSVEKRSRERSMKDYFASGGDFEKWKSDPFLALAMYIQMQQEFGWEPFKKLFTEYRDLADDQRPKTDDQKRDQWMVRFSMTVKRNLGPFFQAWGVPTSEKARASIANLPAWMPDDIPAK